MTRAERLIGGQCRKRDASVKTERKECPKREKGNDTPRAHSHTRDIAQALRNKDTAEAHEKRESFFEKAHKNEMGTQRVMEQEQRESKGEGIHRDTTQHLARQEQEQQGSPKWPGETRTHKHRNTTQKRTKI